MKAAVSGILLAGSINPSIYQQPHSEAAQEAIITRAAFDIGSGACRVTVADIDVNTNRIHYIWFQNAQRVELRKDLATSQDNKISEKIQIELIDALLDLKERVNSACKVNQWSAIGTSVFRTAANGQEFIEKIEKEIGIKIALLPQEEEGKVGFLSAIAMSKKSPEEVISWDSGMGSFQITTMKEGKMEVYGTEVALVSLLEALSSIRNLPFDPLASPHPISEDETKYVKEFLQSKFPPLPDWLIQTDKQVVGIGRFCIFSIAAGLLGKETFTKKDVKQLISRCHDKLDEDFKDLEVPAYGMPGLILLYSVMEHCNIHQVTFCQTNGSAEGMLITPALWE